VNGKLLAITPGKADRTLASGVDAVTFGSDASTVYAVKVTRGGANDDATVYAIGFTSGTTTTLSTINFAHPATEQRSQLDDARFFDEGGMDRLYATSDGNVVLWVAKGGQWRIDPVSGDTIAVARQPVLWSPDGTRRISVTENGAISTLAVVDATGATISRVQVTGLLSHLRWSPKGDHVAFTLGINSANGGVRQDLNVWDLVNGRKPRQLTANGASFGAEWLGVAQFWQP
jgi:WD40 repeat protein